MYVARGLAAVVSLLDVCIVIGNYLQRTPDTVIKAVLKSGSYPERERILLTSDFLW